MGGSSKKQTVGYKYYAGFQMILARLVHRVLRIRVDEDDAWLGRQSEEGVIKINAPNLFGGDDGVFPEGGIIADVNFQPGLDSQQPDPYLQSKLGNDIPASRGVSGLVCRQGYLGNNPYLKQWEVRCERIHIQDDGSTQWYDEKAEIGNGWGAPQAIYIALDRSTSMNDNGGGGASKFTNAKIAINGVLDYIKSTAVSSGARVDIEVVGWASTAVSIVKRSAKGADIDAIKTWVTAMTDAGPEDTQFPAAVGGTSAFYNGAPSNAIRTFIICTDGTPTPVGTELTTTLAAQATLFNNQNLHSYGFNINEPNTTYTQYLDNSGGPVPVISGADPTALQNAITATLGGFSDMNPIHMLRECLLNQEWGFGYDAVDIDDTNFKAAADQLWAETFGLSYLWDDESVLIDDVIEKILDHIDASLYVDRRTQLWTITLLRADYDQSTLPNFASDNEIISVEDFARPQFMDLTNSITVKYYNMIVGGDASITLPNPALFLQQGVSINKQNTYDMCCNPSLASKLGQRDLRAESTPLATGTVYLRPTADTRKLHRGSVCKLTFPECDLNGSVVRINSITFGDGKTTRIKASFVEDVFAQPADVIVTPEPPQWTDPAGVPNIILHHMAIEVPYYELLQTLGDVQLAQNLATDPSIGYLGVSAVHVDSALTANMYVDNGGGYENSGHVDFCPFGVLDQAIGRFDTLLYLNSPQELDEVALNSIFKIDNEFMSFTTRVGNNVSGLSRGLFDTLPAKHAAGAEVFFFDAYLDSDNVTYGLGDLVNVKVTSVTMNSELPLDLAAVDTVAFNERAIRPYPPGNVKINGTYWPKVLVGALALTWAHRNRVVQADQVVDWKAGDISPEAGQTYTLRLYNEAGTLVRTQSVATTSYTWADSDERLDSGLPAEASAWTPANLPTVPTLWLNDQGSVVDAGGGLCSSWADNSSGGHTMVQTTNARRPTITPAGLNGKRTLTFAGAQSMLASSVVGTDFRNVAAGYIFCVYQLNPADTGANYRSLLEIETPSATFVRAGLFAGTSTNANRAAVGGRRLDGDTLTFAQSATARSATWVMALGVIDYTADTLTLYINGTSDIVSTGAWSSSHLNTSNTQAANIILGDSSSSGTHAMRGQIAELYVGSGYKPLTADIDRMFGAAAWYWGLVANLPSGHPYKTAPPLNSGGSSGFRLNGKVRFELESLRSGFPSLNKYSYTVYRTGYGYNYGQFYGGVDSTNGWGYGNNYGKSYGGLVNVP